MDLKGGGRLPNDATTRWLLGGAVVLVMLAGLVVSARPLLLALRRRERLIAPWRRHRLVPWSGLEVAAALVLYLMIPVAAISILEVAGFLQQASDIHKLSGEALYRRLWVTTLVAPWTVPAILLLLWYGSQTKPRHLGLTRWRWRESLALGYCCFFVITPIVYGLNYLAYRTADWTGIEPQLHPLYRLIETGDWPAARFLVVVQAIVLAPMVEELIFRGIMLPWLSQRWWGGWAAMAGAIAIGIANALPREGRIEWMPLVFVLAASLAGVCFTLRDYPGQNARRAIVGTALLFAMFHVGVWPTPIALLVLGLALGWSAYRSRNLIAPLTLHALFNALSTVLMLAGVQTEPMKPSQPAPQVTPAEAPTPPPAPGPETSALRPRSPASDARAANKPGQ